MPPPTLNSEEPTNWTDPAGRSLNAPFGARCFLAGCDIEPVKLIIPTS